MHSVNVTEPRRILIKERQLDTSIFKRAVAGAVAVDQAGFVGEQRYSKRMCEPEDHAVYVYPHEHYAHWQAELGCAPFELGQFGENLTSVGLLESDVRIGDVLRCGTVVLRVRQPRLPCAKLDARMGLRFAGRLLRSRRVGFFASVVVPGHVAAGDPIEVVERDDSAPTIDDLLRLSQIDYWDAVGLEGLLAAEALPAAWRELVRDRLDHARAAVGWHGLRPLEVVERTVEAVDVVSLWLRCPYGRPLAPFAPGQHVSVAWRHAPDEPARRRSYALTSDPHALERYRITIARAASSRPDRPAGTVSIALHDEVRCGDQLRVAAPRGAVTLADVGPESRGVLFVSEGIGVATIVPLVREWARRLEGVPAVHLHVDRSQPHVALCGELASLASSRLRRIIALRQRDPGDRDAVEISGDLDPDWLQPIAATASEIFVAGSSDFVDHVTAVVGPSGARIHAEGYGRDR